LRLRNYGVSTYDEWYFERRVQYSKKIEVIQRYYLKMLFWASHASPWNLLDGQGKMALDVGCAYGFVKDLLDRLGYCAFGMDASRFAIRQGTKLRIDKLALSDISHLPFRASSFDLVTCFEVLEHVSDPKTALNELHRILKPRGILLMSTPSTGAIARLIDLLTLEPFTSHISIKSVDEWTKLLFEASFLVIKTQPFLLLPVPPRLLDRYFTLECPFRLSSHTRLLAVKIGHGVRT